MGWCRDFSQRACASCTAIVGSIPISSYTFFLSLNIAMVSEVLVIEDRGAVAG